MEPRGLKTLTPACHAVAKRTANTGNYLIYNSFLIKLSAEISAVLSKQKKVRRSISISSFYILY